MLSMAARRATTRVSVVVAVILLLTGCAPTPRAPDASADNHRPRVPDGVQAPPAELRIGAVFDLAADAAPSGREPWRGAALAVETLNSSGGVRLADGSRRALRLVVYDDAGSADRSSLATRNLAEEEGDGVLAIVAATSRESAAVAAELAERTGIPLLTLVDPDAGALPRSRRWTFSLALDAEQAVPALVGFLAGRPTDRLGWIAPATATAAAARAILRRHAAAAGLSVVADESYGPGDGEPDEPIGRLLSAGADQIVDGPRDARDAARIARAASTRLPRQRLHLGPPAATDAFLVLAGDAATGARVVAPRLAVSDDLWDHDPLTPPARDFVRAFRLRHGQHPSPAAGAGWDAVRLLAQAVERSAPERAALRDAIEATPAYFGATGSVRFDPADHVGLDAHAFVIARVVPGGWRLPP